MIVSAFGESKIHLRENIAGELKFTINLHRIFDIKLYCFRVLLKTCFGKVIVLQLFMIDMKDAPAYEQRSSAALEQSTSEKTGGYNHLSWFIFYFYFYF